MKFFSKIPSAYKLCFWLAVPLVLLLLPRTFFDEGHSICLSILILGKACPACGLTRATQHALHLDFGTAWQYNKLIVVVLPLLFFVWLTEVKRLFKKIKSK